MQYVKSMANAMMIWADRNLQVNEHKNHARTWRRELLTQTLQYDTILCKNETNDKTKYISKFHITINHTYKLYIFIKLQLATTFVSFLLHVVDNVQQDEVKHDTAIRQLSKNIILLQLH